MANFVQRRQLALLTQVARIGFALCFILPSISASALAQPNGAAIKWANLKHDKPAIEAMLRNGDVPPGDQGKFEKFFTGFVLPPIAKVAGPNQTTHDLPAVRADIKKYFRIGTGSAYDQLNKIVRDFMKLVVKSRDTDPESKVNALLVLRDLNESEAAPPKSAKPLPDSLNDFVLLLKAPKLPDYLRAVALVGVHRHAEASPQFPMPAATQAEVTNLTLALLNEKEPPAKRQKSTHFYLRRSAAEILGALGNVGKDGANVLAVRDAMNERDAPILFRVGLCSALSQFDYGGASAAKLDLKAIGEAACYAGIDAAKAELARTNKLSQEKQIYIPPSRRTLGYCFSKPFFVLASTPADRKNGRNGLVAAAAGKPEAKSLQGMQTEVNKIIKYLDGLQPPNEVDDQKISDMIAILESALTKRPDAAKLQVDVAGATDAAGKRGTPAAAPR
jgi:hypothetical protein